MHDIFCKVRDVLTCEWDPINIGSNPHLKDEYDSYVRQIIRLLNEDAVTEQDLYQMLQRFEETDILMSVADNVRLQVARKLLTIKETK